MKRLLDRITGRPQPPYDERSVKDAQLDRLERDVRDVTNHVDRLVPSPQPLRRELDRAVRIIQGRQGGHG